MYGADTTPLPDHARGKRIPATCLDQIHDPSDAANIPDNPLIRRLRRPAAPPFVRCRRSRNIETEAAKPRH